jgi:hypothetical protein
LIQGVTVFLAKILFDQARKKRKKYIAQVNTASGESVTADLAECSFSGEPEVTRR